MAKAATSEVLHTVAMDAARNSAIADLAGITPAMWASATGDGHVFDSRSGWVGGRNRGRLPFVEVDTEPTQYDLVAVDGGQSTTTVRWYIHVGGQDQRTAQNLAEVLAAGILATFRNSDFIDINGNYARYGDDLPNTWETTPLGHMLTVTSVVEHSWCRSDYELDDFTPGAETDQVGRTIDITFDDTSPIAILAIPDTHSLDNVEVRLTQAFDDPAATFSIGVTGDPEKYYTVNDVDLDGPLYNYVRDFDESGPVTIVGFLSPAAATQGSLRVQVTTIPIGA